MKISRKFLVVLIVLSVIFSGILVNAKPISDPEDHLKDAWAPIQVDFLTLHIPTTEHYPTINGLRVGIPITYNDGAYVNGIDISFLLSANTYTTGIQFSFIGTQARDLEGLQFSLVNFIKGKLYGLQVGGVNYVKQACGLQFGLFNYSEDSQGIVQIGVLNINKNGWLPWCILLNFNF